MSVAGLRAALLRGGVGRFNRAAYAYFMIPSNQRTVLENDAKKRLQAIQSNSDLGAGFNIAMEDLEIRGAGNLLGQAPRPPQGQRVYGGGKQGELSNVGHALLELSQEGHCRVPESMLLAACRRLICDGGIAGHESRGEQQGISVCQ